MHFCPFNRHPHTELSEESQCLSGLGRRKSAGGETVAQ